LTPGNYQIEAQMSGFQPATRTIEVKPGMPLSIALKLDPALLALELMADTDAGEVWYDDTAAGELDSAQWIRNDITPGEHKLKLVKPGGQVSFTFVAVPGALPSLKGHIIASRFHAIVIGTSEDRIRVSCSFFPAQLSADGRSPVRIGADGAELNGLATGSHKLTFTQANEEHTVNIDLGPVPT